MKSQNLTTSAGSPLTPAPADKVREAVVKMLAAFPSSESPSTLESRIGTYCAMLSEYPMAAIVESAKAFLAGRVKGYNPAFAPSVPQWASEARRLRDEARAAQYQPKAIAPPEKPRNPEEREKVAALFDGLMRKMDAAPKKPIAPPEDELSALAQLASQPIQVSSQLIERISK